jgi:hypothetical protein
VRRASAIAFVSFLFLVAVVVGGCGTGLAKKSNASRVRAPVISVPAVTAPQVTTAPAAAPPTSEKDSSDEETYIHEQEPQPEPVDTQPAVVVAPADTSPAAVTTTTPVEPVQSEPVAPPPCTTHT